MTNGTEGGKHRFVPVVRRGFRPDGQTYEGKPENRKSPSKQPDKWNDNTFNLSENSNADPIKAPIQFSVDLTIHAQKKGERSYDTNPTEGKSKLSQPSKDVRMYGPGDAVGIDKEQIARVEPEPGTGGAPKNYFPLVEFERPDLPWILSPERAVDDAAAAPNNVSTKGHARLRPWIALVTVREKDATVTTEGGGGLPTLEVPTAELPPISDVWAWAHAQVLDPGGDTTGVIRNDPSRAISRLLSPRNFYADEGSENRYISAVVPTFEPGRKAGLGRDPYPDQGGNSSNGNNGSDGTARQEVGMAWSSDDDEVKLPVYYMWEFTVGDGDFESLAADLEPTNLADSKVGIREIDASDPGPESLEGYETYTQTGALIAPKQATALQNPSQNDHVSEYGKQQALRTILNRVETIKQKLQNSPATARPVVGAPLYGQWPAGVETIPDEDDSWWLYELNLDLKYRAAAGLGAEVIREHQEEYVAEAWEQVGELEELNRELRRGQFGRSVANHTFTRLVETVTDGTSIRSDRMARFMQFTSQAHEYMADPSPGLEETQQSLKKKLEGKLDELDLPKRIFGGTYKRLSRPGGPLVRNATFTPDTPTELAMDFTAPTGSYAKLSKQDIASDLDSRVTNLSEFANGGGGYGTQPMSMTVSGEDGVGQGVTLEHVPGSVTVEGSLDPDLMSSTEFPTLAKAGTDGRQGGGDGGGFQGTDVGGNQHLGEGGYQVADLDGYQGGYQGGFQDEGVLQAGEDSSIPEGSLFVSESAPDANLNFTPAPIGQSRVPDAQLVRSYRLGSWNRSMLADELGGEQAVTPHAIWTAAPDNEGTFAVKKVDAQIQSGLDHSKAALGAIRGVKSGVVDPAEAERRIRAIRTNALESLDRTVNEAMDASSNGVPSEVEQDRTELLEELRTDLENALSDLEDLRTDLPGSGPDPDPDPEPDPDPDDPDVDPEKWVQDIHDKLSMLRQGIYGVGQGDLSTGDLFDGVGGPDDVGVGGDGPVEIPELAGVLEKLDPKRVIPKKVTARIRDNAGNVLEGRDDPLREVMWSPTIDRPMQVPLAGLADEYLLPGANDIPKDSVGALATNQAFIEAYMTGLSHEFARELIWRRFPTDRMGTYFETFWNRANNPDIPDDERPVPDLDGPIHTWKMDSPLGGGQNRPSNVVLLLRSELLRQFPNTVIYMAKAKWEQQSNSNEYVRSVELNEARHYTADNASRNTKIEFPQFRGRLDPDVTFVGFDVTPSQAVGHTSRSDGPPGWFFVIEEPMGEPRFGLDEGEKPENDTPKIPLGIQKGNNNNKHGGAQGADRAERPINSLNQLRSGGSSNGGGEEPAWDGLSWWHVAGNPKEANKYVDVWNSTPGGKDDRSGSGPPTTADTWQVSGQQVTRWEGIGNLVTERPELKSMRATWAHNSAHMARITWQRPVRVIIHADDLLSGAARNENWTNVGRAGGT